MFDTEEAVRPPAHPWSGKRPADNRDASDLRRLRAKIVGLAAEIVAACPFGPERQEALEHLDAVAFHVVGSFRSPRS